MNYLFIWSFRVKHLLIYLLVINTSWFFVLVFKLFLHPVLSKHKLTLTWHVLSGEGWVGGGRGCCKVTLLSAMLSLFIYPSVSLPLLLCLSCTDTHTHTHHYTHTYTQEDRWTNRHKYMTFASTCTVHVGMCD